jgi:hypothetical protein
MPGETAIDRQSFLFAANWPSVQVPAPQEEQQGPSYYDISMLQKPVWSWEVAAYFFFGGLSAGAYLLSRMAERFGGERRRDITRVGTWSPPRRRFPALRC